MYRVYIEDFDEEKGIWVVDEGSYLTAQRFDKVVTSTVGYTNYNLNADNTLEPKCWLEYPDCKLKIIGRTALLR